MAERCERCSCGDGVIGDGSAHEHYRRAGGTVLCEQCNKTYYKHPLAMEYLDWQGEPFLNRLCNGELVKL